MTWEETNTKAEKIKFIAEWLEEEFNFADLCRRYGISRKTGYKLINRYEMEGERALEERSHTRHYHPNAIGSEIQTRLIELKYRYPKWGPAKLKDWLRLNEPGLWPAASTIGDLLKRQGLVQTRKYRRHVPAHSQPFVKCNASNRVWSADFKGQFRLGDSRYCYPLTITDNYSRFLLACDGFVSPNLRDTLKSFKRVFIEYGLPDAILTDNGQPFAGVGIGGLTQLSIWWLKLGIMPERIEAGCPQQNGRHERMHRTLKEAVAKPAEDSFRQQQMSFDHFRREYNYERPHEGLAGKRPADVYFSSKRELLNKAAEISYPQEFIIRKVRTNGEIKWFGKKYYVTSLLHQEPIGLKMIDEGRAMLYFAKLKLGIIDARADKIIRP